MKYILCYGFAMAAAGALLVTDSYAKVSFDCKTASAPATPAFVEAVNSALECIRNVPSLRPMLTHLNSPNTHTITICPSPSPFKNGSATDKTKSAQQPGVGSSATVTWTPPPPGGCNAPENANALACVALAMPVDGGGFVDDGAYNNPVATLAHELYHAWQSGLGKMIPKDQADDCSKGKDPSGKGIAKGESDAVKNAENKVRALPCADGVQGGDGKADIRKRYDNKDLCVCGNGIVEDGETCDGDGKAQCARGTCQSPGKDDECTCVCDEEELRGAWGGPFRFADGSREGAMDANLEGPVEGPVTGTLVATEDGYCTDDYNFTIVDGELTCEAVSLRAQLDTIYNFCTAETQPGGSTPVNLTGQVFERQGEYCMEGTFEYPTLGFTGTWGMCQ